MTTEKNGTERLIKEEGVDKEMILQPIADVTERIKEIYENLIKTGESMEQSAPIIETITKTAEELRVSKEYEEFLREDPHFVESIIQDTLDADMEFWIAILKQKGIELDEKEIGPLKTRQKTVTNIKLKKKVEKFNKVKDFIKKLVTKASDLGEISNQISKVREYLNNATERNKKAQISGQVCIDVMEVLCTEFNEEQKIDELTGIGNKKYFEHMGSKLVEHKSNFHIVFIDMNGLKQVNDSYGHGAGDSLLKDFAKDLANVTGEGKNTAFRLHGDEFTVISQDSLEDITAKMAKLTEWLENRRYKIMHEGKVVHIEGGFAYGIETRGGLNDYDERVLEAEKETLEKWEEEFKAWKKKKREVEKLYEEGKHEEARELEKSLGEPSRKILNAENKFTPRQKNAVVFECIKQDAEKKMYGHKARMKGEENKYGYGEEE